MDLNGWPHLRLLLEAASSLQPLQVWLFGSALRSEHPADLDVLLVYEDRSAVVALRKMEPWEDFQPPFHIIAMTPREVDEYEFIKSTRAVRLI
ncbi:nucleotidyltransferase domain-containing protein [Streptomyces sp. NPDC050636]|uniref:nucleotidyltransferase domain-containing protein n=1 Tax=Streptomyces sp. NPDC050636 TaxID=3154510 RepID=UPI00343FAB81